VQRQHNFENQAPSENYLNFFCQIFRAVPSRSQNKTATVTYSLLLAICIAMKEKSAKMVSFKDSSFGPSSLHLPDFSAVAIF
jgi:hypothetical protein